MATFLPNVTDIFPEPALFNPDFSYMDKMLQRRKAMYDQGFAQVNSAYNYVNRETTNPYNSKLKDQFLRQAKDNLKNLSAMDLSHFQNVKTATSVFAPFQNNTDVIGDQALTEHWNNEISLGNSFRYKDGGKEFNQKNIDYINQQKKWFSEDTPNTWREYYGMKRSYVPYYDASKEIQEAMKNFKPSHKKTIQKNGFYLQVVDDESWYEGEIAQYLKGVLSDKALQQWRIEGAVKYGNDPSLLTSVYSQQAQSVTPKIQSQIDDLSIQLRQEKDPVKIQELTKKLQDYQQMQDNLSQNLKTISSADLRALRNNSEALAFDIYYNEKISEISKAYSHLDIEQDIKFDDIAKMFWENDQKWRLEGWKRENQVEDRNYDAALRERLARISASKGDSDGSGGSSDILVQPLVESGSTTGTSTGYQGLKDQVEVWTNRAHSKKEDLIKYIRSKNNLPPGKEITKGEFLAFMKANPGDQYVMDYVKSRNLVEGGLKDLELFRQNAHGYISEKMGETKSKLLQLYKTKLSQGKLDVNSKKYYDILENEYQSHLKQYVDPKFTLQGTTTFGYSINPGSKNFKLAAGVAANYTGLDVGKINSFTYLPEIDGSMGIRFNYQKTDDNDKNTAKKILESKLAGTGAKLESWTDEGVVTIKNAGGIMPISDYDPYKGLDYETKSKLLLAASRNTKGSSFEFTIPMVSKQRTNLMFLCKKESLSTGDVYYLLDGKKRVITDATGVSAYSSAQQLGQNLKLIAENFSDEDLYKLLYSK